MLFRRQANNNTCSAYGVDTHITSAYFANEVPASPVLWYKHIIVVIGKGRRSTHGSFSRPWRVWLQRKIEYVFLRIPLSLSLYVDAMLSAV